MFQIVSPVIHFSANDQATRQQEGEIVHTVLPSFPSLACKLLTCPLPVKVLQGETERGRAVSLCEDKRQGWGQHGLGPGWDRARRLP